MEAKDTVMGEGEIWGIMDGHYQGDEILKVGRNVAKAQAEISFKAGIRKAVDHLKMHYFIDAPEEMIKEIEDGK